MPLNIACIQHATISKKAQNHEILSNRFFALENYTEELTISNHKVPYFCDATGLSPINTA